jgi:hypothetical protein
MINPVSAAYSSHASQTAQPAAAKAQPQPGHSFPQDQVTLKSTGDADHDGDSK